MDSQINIVRHAYQLLGQSNSFLKTDKYKHEEIASGVEKYFIHENGIEHVLVYVEKGVITEVSVYCGKDIISLKEARKFFTNELVGYNFRENYTQFLFGTGDMSYPHVAFILENEIIYDEARDEYIEKTPRGKKSVLSEVVFDGFMLKRS